MTHGGPVDSLYQTPDGSFNGATSASSDSARDIMAIIKESVDQVQTLRFQSLSRRTILPSIEIPPDLAKSFIASEYSQQSLPIIEIWTCLWFERC